MPHLATGPGLTLAVQMHLRAGLRQQRGQTVHVVADQVLHLDIGIALTVAQRQADHGADMLLELVDGAARLRPMARIMDPS